MRAVNAEALDRDVLAAIAALNELSPNWRGKAERRLAGIVPDPRARLQGDPS
jgi:hypothetical protein